LNIGLAYSLWTNSEHGLACYLALQERKQALEGRLAEVQEENRALSRKIRLLEGNQRYLEYTLHVRGRYVRPGEILYLFTPKDLRQEEGVGE
jgi:cell division protein FtsB